MSGRLCFVLHAHLPFVRHPEESDTLEEDWLFEAILESYVPILLHAGRWADERIPARVTLSISPTLAEMLADRLLLDRASVRFERVLRVAEAERLRLNDDPERGPIARFNLERLSTLRDAFEQRYRRDLISEIGRLARAGVLELSTSAATHAFLPLFISEPGFVRGQIRIGVASFRRHFGADPAGLWLPECGFHPGLDQMLADEGVSWFVLDTHGVTDAQPAPVYGHHLPLVCPSGVAAFARDPVSSRQVWSAQEGYPGDARYREHYRDAGFDLPADALGDLVLGDGTRRALGLKYHRVTGPSVPLAEKALYQPDEAQRALDEHARHFVEARIRDMAATEALISRPPVVLAPYDAELFGHWWFEGPDFLDRVVRRAADAGRGQLELCGPSQVLSSGEKLQVSTPAASSWGDRGYAAVWLNDKNAWIWPHLHHAAKQMVDLASSHLAATGLEQRALAQLAREILLASASDWPFILNAGTMSSYAERRLREHLSRFLELAGAIRDRRIDQDSIAALEREWPFMPELDFRAFSR